MLLKRLFLTVFLGPAVLAQSNSVTTNTASGVMPYSLYGGAQENINFATGNLNLQSPLLTLPGRAGHDLNVGLTYDSKNRYLTYTYNEYTGQIFYSSPQEQRFPRVTASGTGGWRVNAPYITSSTECDEATGLYRYDTDFIVTLPDGSRHHFDNEDNSWFYSNGCGISGGDGPAPLEDIPLDDSNDASFMRLDTSPSDHAILRMKDGTRIYFYGIRFSGTAPTSVKVVDPDGNFILYSYGAGLITITDSIGRVVSLVYSPTTSNLSEITYKDAAGTQRSITLGYAGNLSAINLPNGRSYSFEYNANGELSKITYPTGGYTRYDYATYQAWHQLYLFSTSADFREVTAKYVCPKETGACTAQEEQATTYTPTIQASYSNNSSTQVIDPLGNKTVHTFTYSVNAPDLLAGEAIAAPRELTRQVYEGTTILLRTIQTEYVGTVDTRLPSRVTTTLETGLVSKVEWIYGTYTNLFNQQSPIDNVIEQRDFDYGNVAKRKTKFTYLKVNPINGQNYESTAIFILNRKTKQEVYDWNGSSETLKARTEWEYDSYTEGLTASGTVQHDSAYGTSYTKRGNVTATLAWRDNPAATLTTRNQFDDAGNIRKTTDPLGHATTLSYTDSWANTVCQPVGGSAKAYVTSVTNALSHVTTSAYNSCSGTVAAATDPNNQTATFSYDLMNRLVQTNLPGGGQTTRTYNEGSVPLSLTTTTKITASMNLVTTVTVDGLGREVLSSLDSDPEGATRTKTEYDALGQKKRVYNPTRCPVVETNCGENTWGYAENVYDGLGRVSKVRPPDGTLNPDSNIITTSYSGNTVTVTDQAGKKRKSESDALGRLIRVWEPDAGQNLIHVTRYQYGVLDNLLCVHQKSIDATADKVCGDATVPAAWRERRFTYNSLSQLLTAYNPESGNITHTYDNDGNLTTRTDARSITITHAYDALHRLAGKTHSNGDPAISYLYDQTSYNGLTIANGKGHRTGMTDAAGVQAWTYDAVGRVLTDRRTTNGVTKDFSYLYNLDGSVWKITYPTGRTIEYQPTGAGRTEWAKDVANSVNYATVASYAPSGALRSVVHGQAADFAGYTLTQTFNNRLQPNTVVATSPSSTLLDFTYDFVDTNGNNNGNVDAILNNRNHNRDQNFTYDELNRIKTAQSAATSGGDCWGLQYSFDIYANLLSAAVTKCSETALSLSVDTKNRVTNTGFSYDLSGNTLNDGSFSYAWDAESRMKSGADVTYTYDGDGRRVQKSNGKLYWYGMGREPLGESDLSGNVSEEYIFFGGKRIARRVVSSSTVFYYFADHLGTSRVIAQANATTACFEADYTPYGKERVITDTCPQNYKFTGKERDPESTLDYFGARHYSWAFGRFHSPDLPFIDQKLGNPQSWNLYVYVRNNPLKFVDPTGNYLQPYGASPNDMLPNVTGSNFIGGGQTWALEMAISGTPQQIEQTVGGESDETTTTSEDVEAIAQEGSQSNIDTRNAIAATAEKYDGSTAWAYDQKKGVFPAQQNKCNQFVGDVVAEAGAQAVVPGKDGKPIQQADGKPRPPTAAEWASPGRSIPNWRALKLGEALQPGDVAAHKIGRGDRLGATGHSGIIIRDRNTGGLTSISAHDSRVGPPNAQFFGRTDVVFRRYTGP